MNLTETHGVFVRVRAGIDVLAGDAIWEFQTIDQATGNNLKLFLVAFIAAQIIVILYGALISRTLNFVVRSAICAVFAE